MDTFSPPTAFESYVRAYGCTEARRLVDDISVIRQAPEWEELSETEREQRIEMAIVGQIQNGDNGKVFPRLQLKDTRRKLLVSGEELGSIGEDSDTKSSEEDPTANAVYGVYVDEHSAPFSWLTRSQQDLPSFGHEALVEDDDEEVQQQRETLVAKSIVRASRGNPAFAKAVAIPNVPQLHTAASKRQSVASVTSVPPEQINNFVYQTENNRLVLDFGEFRLDGDYTKPPSVPAAPASNGSTTSSSKNVFGTLKKTLSLRRSRRRSSADSSNGTAVSAVSPTSATPASESSWASTLPRPGSAASSNAASNAASRPIVKPSVAPPPPPVNKISDAPQKISPCEPAFALPTSLPSPTSPTSDAAATAASALEERLCPRRGPPPPPPPRRTSVESSKQIETRETKEVLPENISIDLSTNSDLPKTGFDFLDNW